MSAEKKKEDTTRHDRNHPHHPPQVSRLLGNPRDQRRKDKKPLESVNVGMGSGAHPGSGAPYFTIHGNCPGSKARGPKMSRGKTRPGTSMRPWQTPAEDNWARRYFLLDADFFEHPAVVALPNSALRVLLILQAHCAGNSAFTFPYKAAEKAGVSSTSFSAALRELESRGFVRITSGKANLTANQIEFVTAWKSTAPTPPKRKPRGKSLHQNLQ